MMMMMMNDDDDGDDDDDRKNKDDGDDEDKGVRSWEGLCWWKIHCRKSSRKLITCHVTGQADAWFLLPPAPIL